MEVVVAANLHGIVAGSHAREPIIEVIKGGLVIDRGGIGGVNRKISIVIIFAIVD